MFENRHDRKIEIEFEYPIDLGYQFVPRSGKTTLVMDSGQKEFVMKLIPFQKSEVKDLIRQETVRVKAFD